MIFLHGVNSSSAELQPFVEAMQPYAPVRTPNWLGHGGRPIPAGITLRSLADDVVAWMDREGIERGIVGGYSLGGTIALVMARHYPERVSGIVALAAKHRFDPDTMQKWKYLASRERIEKVRFSWGSRSDELAKAHAPNHWHDVLPLVARFFEQLPVESPLGDAELRAIRAPAIVISSDQDQIVPWEETMALGRALPDAHVAKFYGPGHPLRLIPLAAIARTIGQWMRDKGLNA